MQFGQGTTGPTTDGRAAPRCSAPGRRVVLPFWRLDLRRRSADHDHDHGYRPPRVSQQQREGTSRADDDQRCRLHLTRGRCPASDKGPPVGMKPWRSPRPGEGTGSRSASALGCDMPPARRMVASMRRATLVSAILGSSPRGPVGRARPGGCRVSHTRRGCLLQRLLGRTDLLDAQRRLHRAYDRARSSRRISYRKEYARGYVDNFRPGPPVRTRPNAWAASCARAALRA